MGHPFDALYCLGCAVTANTDNRSMIGTTLTNEPKLSVGAFAHSTEDLLVLQLNASRGAFLGPIESSRARELLLSSVL